jgi:CBS-domain-containing membrane protein
VVGLLAVCVIAELSGYKLLIGSFAASSVLIYGACESPLAQPRNLVGGHVISALAGVLAVSLLGTDYVAIAVAVGLAIFLMHITHTLHPPGGATALIGVQANAHLSFIVIPVLLGALILLAVALFTNNIVNHRKYPRHWW